MGSVTKVLYILGRGRSGSTIFANVIGAHEGFFSAGEVRYVWDPVAARDGGCACGRPVSSCPVWSKVLDRVSDVSVEEAGAWQRAVVTERNLPRLLRHSTDGRWPAADNYIRTMARIYDAIRDVTGASVIVDSSKRPSYAAVVRLLPSTELCALHLVRDPRASAYSWATTRHKSVFGGGAEVRRRNAFDSTLRWNVLNIEAELLLRKLPAQRRLRLRYEDFVAAPRVIADEVIRFAGAETAASPFLDDRSITLRDNHTIAGNPSRFSAGTVTIEDRGDWRSGQTSVDRTVATAVAAPFLRRYGYRARIPRSTA
ncbi:MAG TPA: sulfotransferase [Vicinamibacterales bacterium]|nr:sulfotransferase [Vicinamibacterales bacterium]